jgi:tetratricopeptide (TPR) repeat protein
MSKGCRMLSTAALVALVTPGLLDAQEGVQRPMYELPSITVTAPSESDPLYESAAALYQAGEWAQAAELYKDAAEGMPENDPNSYLTFDQSARLYFYAGEYGDARQMMEQAANVAEATGDMVSAAYRHVDAAFIAVWEGYPGMRREHIKTAEGYLEEHEFSKDDADRIMALTRGVGLLPVGEED